MNEVDDARAMLRAADVDLQTLGLMVAAGGFPAASVGLHAQQCIEKALKAWLLLTAAETDRTHDIGLLLRRLGAIGEDVQRWHRLAEYTPYAGRIRYADPETFTERLDAAHALAEATALYGHVQSLLPPS
mgnify:CR=1 FL=1